ncbi:hypothetical protein H9L39_04804 [Fusarium oxysporum f. sp. albedinis]|nr:hypothetical protein H9L39_04804 [Fusarium oxysporum f. sp. albedinis]
MSRVNMQHGKHGSHETFQISTVTAAEQIQVVRCNGTTICMWSKERPTCLPRHVHKMGPKISILYNAYDFKAMEEKREQQSRNQ